MANCRCLRTWDTAHTSAVETTAYAKPKAATFCDTGQPAALKRRNGTKQTMKQVNNETDSTKKHTDKQENRQL